MKLSSYIALFCLVSAVISCGKKSSSHDEDDHSAADAAIADDPAVCAEIQELGLHGDVEGYTASAAGMFQVKIDWSSPLVAGELTNSAKVTFLSHHGEPLALNLFGVKLFMPAMGHGSIKGDKMVLTQDATNKNVWSVDQVYFSMGGGTNEWVADVEAGACGLSDKARVLIPVEVQ